MAASTSNADSSTAPPRANLVLLALLAVAAVANLNLAVASVALPEIGEAFVASQTSIDLIAVGYPLGLAASVLYLGAIGDRHGRKMMLVLGMSLVIPTSVLAAWAPNANVLFGARLFSGVAAGMAFPTTLALITALWSGSARIKSIALWSAVGVAVTAMGPLIGGTILEFYWWGSIFLIAVPFAVLALFLSLRFVPSHISESTDPIDNIGGLLSVVTIGALIVAINFIVVPNRESLGLGLAAIALAGGIGFVIRERRAKFPLFDLHVAGRRIFWVAASAGVIVFGSLLGAAFIGQQFLQNVLGYSTLQAGASILPASVFVLLVVRKSAALVEARGSRFTLLIGYFAILCGFLTMLLLWSEGSPYWHIGLAYAFVGVGVGFSGTPASRSLTASVSILRVGMASSTADLERDLGASIMQSTMGALLTAGYAAAITVSIAGAPNADQITEITESQLRMSFAGAANVAKEYPQYADEITTAAKEAFIQGSNWAYAVGTLLVLVGMALVFFWFPKREAEEKLLADYHDADTAIET